MTGIMMRTGIKPGRLPALIGLAAVLAIAPTGLRAAEIAVLPRFAVSLEAGMFRAEQAAFRTLYGGGSLVYSVHLRARLAAGLWAVAAWKTLSVQGTTAIVGPAFDNESYALEFEMTSLRFGLRYACEIGRWAVFAGAGGGANRYEERWTDIAGLGGTGREMGWYAELGGEFTVARFLSLSLRGEYSSVVSGRGSYLEPEVKLGGVETAAGLVFRF